ncbi:MAG TPA: carbamate kinase [Thermoanaerobaculia bacterium]|nr:carbamate kinase [Thermoanaerobaculia bacterium]
MTRTAVIAIGGNSLITDKEHQRVPDQYQACSETCRHVAPLLRDPDLRLVITHGNGPQVGFILRRSELASKELHAVPLDSCVADTQGALGYHLQLALGNEFRRLGIAKTAATVVTLCLVDRDDPAFAKPDKPIGSFLSREEADVRRAADGWDLVEDAGRGWRRVVASPAPKRILELGAVKSLLDAGFVVVAAGGGGIAVIEDAAGVMKGAAAVIDKDHASSLLARQLGAGLFVVSTGVPKVCLGFGTPQEQDIDRMTVADARRLMAEGHFRAGSMLPKIEAVIAFLEGGGREAIITDPSHLGLALAGRAGTHIVP